MEGALHGGKELYIQCCHRRKAKPNKEILAQVDRPDVVLVDAIDASHTFIGRTGVLAILDLTSQHRCLRRLILPQNDVDTACVEHLCEILKSGHQSLHYVDLSYSSLSVPAMRTLWETARLIHGLMEVRLDKCDLPEEWAERLTHQLSKNRERLDHSRRVQRSPINWVSKWHTTFVLLISPNDGQMELYKRHVLQMLSHQAAALRRRLASIMVNADETEERILKKVQYCCEEYPERRVWSVVLLDGTPFTKAQQLALDMVLAVQALDKSERSGLAESLFVYYPTQCKPMNDLEPITSLALPPSSWLALTGCGDQQCIKWASMTQRNAYVLTPEIYKLRCQSDLLSSLRSVYLADSDEDRNISTELTGPVSEMPQRINLSRRPMSTVVKPDSASVERLSKIMLQYIQSAPEETGSSLLIYGVAGAGKSELLRHLAHNFEINSNEYSVIFLEIDSPNGDVVTFLYNVLQILSPAAAQRHYYSAMALQLAVKEAAAAYGGPKRVVLIVSRVDQLDLCGMEDTTCVDWVPSLLPPRLRVVLSFDTDPNLLHYLRQRSPQPLEYLVYPADDVESVDAYCNMLMQRGFCLPGVEQGQTKYSLGPTEKNYAQKSDSHRMFYSRLAAAYTKHLLEINAVKNEEDAALLIHKQLPDSVEELIRFSFQNVAAVYGQMTISWILLSLTISPLGVTDIEEVCEQLGRCPARTSVPALLNLVDFSIVEFDSEAKAHLSHYVICTPIVLHQYACELDLVSVAVETHLHLMTRQYLDVHHNFRHLIPLMLINGNFNAAVDLLNDADLIDRMLSHKNQGFYHVMGAFFRLISACDLVDKLASVGQPLMCITLDREQIECSLRDVQLARGPGFLQRCLLSHNESQLYQSARQLLNCGSGGVPYSVLVPLKTHVGDPSSATLTCTSRLPVIHLNCRGDYLVASTPGDVTVYHTQTLAEVAHLDSPFKTPSGEPILGSLVGIGPRVVVLAATQVFLWNFGANVSRLLEDLSAAVATGSLDMFGDALIAAHPAHSTGFAVFSVTQRLKTRDLPPPQLTGRPRRGGFCGPDPMLVEGHAVRLFDQAREVALLHDGLVGAVDCSNDGQLIAAAVRGVLWLWKRNGTLLHQMDPSLGRIARLSFNPTGMALMVERGDGAMVWQTVTGVLLSRLLNPFGEEHGRVSPDAWMSGNDSLLMGRVGPHAVVWHAESGTPIGALTAQDGVFTQMCEHNKVIYATLSSGGGVKVFDPIINPLPPVQKTKSEVVNSDCLWNGRVSSCGIKTVTMSPFPGSHLVACVDRNGRLYVFSTQSGARLDRVVEPQMQDAPVHTAVVAGPRLVAYVNHVNPCVFFLNLPEDDDPSTPATVTSRPLPKELLWDPEVDAHLYSSQSEPSYLGLTYSYHGRSRMIVYKIGTPGVCFQLIGGGRFIFASFLEQFAYTIEKGQWVRLWNLSKGLERTSYQHSHPIVAAAKCRGVKDSLLCIDSTETMYCVSVREISSPTQASFVLTKIKRPNLRYHHSFHLVHYMVCINKSIILLRAGSDGRAMRLGITAANRDDELHEAPIHEISCISVGVKNNEEVLVIGCTDGRLLFHRVVEPII
ncbi:unnamed protein product [Phytomonas sp. Hart1]|nr:unnamed protein product [Phytomonas sp. Hart1]|eukprot:CCW67926.1 unnamed protein product [Phytomonas sp. isolate Hart1]